MKTENPLIQIFKEKCEESMSQIKDLKQFRESDKMVDEVFKTGRWLFDTDLDVVGEATLVTLGGRLTGIYAYLGNMTARARAERDVWEQKKEEVIAEKSLAQYSKSGKITLAKQHAKLAAAELDIFVIQKEHEKNNFENILNATDRMLSFIQSALKIKGSEKYRTNSNHANG